ncbi:hypothetical protein BDV98DRAFT_606926 [Pterulicium gracile]|uniref:DUF6534 domain-containing protein n=1 Tax=Pterulicium gracile TaxID=1884261 RepID=A0A5C3Q8H6_9AGAR|nr:hypothetical protein BDV98DRAFT_606926 [Pterula gracilis]
MFSAPSPTSAPSLESTLGVLEISVFCVLAMFGFTTMQAYRYFRLSAADRVVLRLSVLFVWHVTASPAIHAFIMVVLNKSNRIANLMTVIGLAYWVHIITIRPDHQLGSLNHSPLLTTITIFFGILAVRIVQAIMSYRIYLFTRSIALTCFLATLTLVSFTGGLCSGVKALRMRKDVNAFQHKNRVLLGVTLGLEAVTDICLAGVTCWYLRRERRRGVRTRTALQLNTLIRWSLQSGIFTSAVVLATALCFILLTDSFWWIGLWVAVPAVYSNSLLALLNGRNSLANINPSSFNTLPVTDSHTSSSQSLPRTRGALTTSFWSHSDSACSSVAPRTRSALEPPVPVFLARPFVYGKVF